ncbi:hypothetical protein GO495_22155 [Chitinophaga oryziterrae]|uniref:Uncharacterized protein n=1 Tax=Chitinophaga oryziterrae TaxID=1031224 RepID=A0A6N8JG71_9BACT|nr:hypothetical protein [Chitinophaga oryziterrae]MVT43318.1 hypothetical protein [Chitinophaga oryziterrae]
MRQVYLKLMILFLALAGTINIARAGTPEDSLVDAQAAIIRKNLAARIQENERLIKAGKAAEASYVVSAMQDQPYSVFTSFTSLAARQLWIKQSLSMRLVGLDQLSSHVNNLNAWISELRKTYLDNTPYKDYKIYFVVSGIYNYKDIERKDPEYDWNKMRTVNYYEQVRTNPGAYTEKEEEIIRAIMSKVKNDKDNSVLKASLEKDKYIVCYLFNLYKNYSGVHAEYHAGMELSESRMIMGSTPEVHNTFIINGIYHSSSIEPSLIAELQNYNKNHQQSPPSDSGTNITTRNDYLSQLIRNVYIFFGQKAGGGLANVDCEHDEGLIDRLEDLYKTPLPNATKIDISVSLKDLTLETRKCLLEKLSQKAICGDNKVLPFTSNLCEQLILDIVRSTPLEQQRAFLDHLNGNAQLLRKLIVKTDDKHELFDYSTEGENNYTELVKVLCQFAYNVYKAELTLAIAETSPCKTLTYDPQAPYNDLSNEVLAHYTDGNQFSFEFRRYRGPCSYQYFDYYGNAQYGNQNFTVDPFAWVSIVPTTDLPFNFFVDGKQQEARGKTLYIPALMLYWNIEKNTEQGIKDNLERAKNVIDVGMLIFGEGWMELKGSKLKKLWAGINNAVTIANTATSDPEIKRWLEGSPMGEKALNALEVISNHVSTPGNIKEQIEKGEVKPETLKTLNDIVVFWQGVMANPPTYDPNLNYASVTTLVREIQEGLLEEDAISTKIPLIAAAGTGTQTGTQPNPQTGTQAPCDLCGNEPLMCKLEKTATYDKRTDALHILCARLQNAWLNPVAKKLDDMDVNELNTFLSDVVNNTPSGANCYTIVNGYLAQNIPSLTVGTVNAWHIYREAGRTCLRVSQPHLTSLRNAIESDVLHTRPYSLTTPDYESIIKACEAQKSQSGTVDNEIFVNLFEFAKRRYDVADFDGMKSNLKNTNPYYTVVGANWVLKYMQQHEAEFRNAYNIRFESTTVYDDMGNRISDLELQRGQAIQYYEFKSYKTTSLPNSNFAEQLIKDMSRRNVTSIYQLIWIFDGSKTDRDAVYKRIKEELLMDKNLTQLNTDRIRLLFNELAGKFHYAYPITNRDELRAFISGADSRWFDEIFKVVQ